MGHEEPWFDPSASYDSNVRECGRWRSQNGYYDHTKAGQLATGFAGRFVHGTELELQRDGTEFVVGDDGRMELRDQRP